MAHDSSLHELLVEYTLGTLDHSERHEFEEHLITCDECRHAVDPTALLVLALEAQKAKAGLQRPVQATPTKVSKLPTPWLIRTGILIIGVAAGLLFGVSIARTPATSIKPTYVIEMASSRTGVDGSLALYQKPWGTQMNATFKNLPTTGKIQMVVATHSGRVTTTWLGTNQSTIALDAAVPYATNAIDWVGVYADSGSLIDSWRR